MYTRIAQAIIKPKRLAQFKDGITNHALPAIRTQPGLMDILEMYSGNNFLCVTFWQTEKDAERYAREVFPHIVARQEPLVDGVLREQSYSVEFNTIQQAEAETAPKMESVPVRKLAAAA